MPRSPLLCLVVDRAATRRPIEACVEAACAAGVDLLQLRERALEGAEWLAFARRIAGAARRGASRAGRPLRIIVNRRLDIAIAIAADGVHLGFDALAPGEARRLLCGAGAARGATSIGVSTHAPAEVAEAAAAGADFAHFAPVFDPLSKPVERPAQGIEALRRATRAPIAVLAQGGIDASRCAAVLAAGAAGVAVTGAILGADDPGDAARALRRALDAAPGAR